MCFAGIITKFKSSSGLFMLCYFFLLCNFSFPKDHPVTNYTIYYRAYSGYLVVILNRNLQIHWPKKGDGMTEWYLSEDSLFV